MSGIRGCPVRCRMPELPAGRIAYSSDAAALGAGGE